MSDKSETPRTVRLRSGIQTVNGITGETAPTYAEYVLLEDYEALESDLAAVTRERDGLKGYYRDMVKNGNEMLAAEKARAEANEKDAARYRKARSNGGFFFSSDTMSDSEIDARIDALPDSEAEGGGGFRLEVQSREAEEARFYRYLRDEAGQRPDDHDGPLICAGLGDNFDYLRGEECDIEIRKAMEASRG